MGITIKQIAADLNVTKPTVSKAIEDCGLSSQLRRVGNRFELTDDQAELIKAKISQTQSKIAKNARKNENKKTNKAAKQDNTADETKNLMIQIMQSQITKKDEQLANLTAALVAAQEQNKQLTEALTAAQSLHAGTIQQQLIEAETVQDSAPVADTSETETAAETETPVEPTKKASFRERLSFLLHGK